MSTRALINDAASIAAPLVRSSTQQQPYSSLRAQAARVFCTNPEHRAPWAVGSAIASAINPTYLVIGVAVEYRGRRLHGQKEMIRNVPTGARSSRFRRQHGKRNRRGGFIQPGIGAGISASRRGAWR